MTNRLTASRNALAALMAAVVATLSLAACGGGGGAGAHKTLTMWTFKVSEVSALRAVAAQWKKTSGVDVKISVYTPEDVFTTKVRAAARSKALPDIISTLSVGMDWMYAQSGLLKDLTGEFDSSWSKQIRPGVLQSIHLTQDRIKSSGSDPATTLKNLKAGHTYAVPYLAGTPGVIYVRKSTLAKAGLTSPPKTWAQLVAAVSKTQQADPAHGGIVTGLKETGSGYLWLYLPLSYAYLGKNAYLDRQGRDPHTTWNSPGSEKTLELYNQLTPLWTPGVLALGIDEADQAFADSKAAWDIGGTFTFSTLAANKVAAKDLDVFPIPAASGGALSSIGFQANALVSAGVSSTSRNSAQAVSFLKYLTSPAGARIFADKAADVPATTLSVSDVHNPIVKQMLSLTSDSPNSFNASEFTAVGPGGGAGPTLQDSADLVNALPSKTSDPNAVSEKLTALYKRAWSRQS